MQSSITSSYSITEAGPLSQWSAFQFVRPGLSSVAHKFFLKDRLGLTGMEISLNEMPPGGGMPFTHRHRENEEVYLFLSGEGEFQADGERIPIQPGTCIRCSQKTSRAWRNSGSEPLRFVVIQAKADSYGPGSTTDDGERANDAPLWLKNH